MNGCDGSAVKNAGCPDRSGVERRSGCVDSTVGSEGSSESSGLSDTCRSDSGGDIISTFDG